MSIDFQVVFPQEVIEVNSVTVLPGTPKTLDILGKDFRSVDEVLINEVVSPSVIILSRNKLLAQVPTLVGNNAIQSLTVTSRQLTLTDKSLIRFRLGQTTSKVRGILKLLQLYVKVLFTTPGSDILSQRIGADALRNIGRTFGKSESGGIVSDFVLANDIAVRQIVSIQGRDPSVPRDERLLSARIRAAKYSQRETALLVSTEVTSQAGRTATANITV